MKLRNLDRHLVRFDVGWVTTYFFGLIGGIQMEF